MMPELSVIVPVYNTKKYLRRCLESILAQTVQDMEIICVNDGSTDGSEEILEEYAKEDSRIHIVSQENKGLGAARNAGILKAKGEYIGFVDSDDFIEPDMYEKMLGSARQHDSDIVLTNINLYYTDSGKTDLFRSNVYYDEMESMGGFTAVEYPRIMQFIGAWDRIYRRAFLEEHRLQNPVNRIYEDVLFTVQCNVLAKRISVVNKPLYYYRKNTGVSIVDKEVKNDSYKFDFLKNLEESKAFLVEQDKFEMLGKEFLAFQLTGIMFHQYNMQTRASFLQFMTELSRILSASDIEIMNSTTNIWAVKVYLNRVKKKRFKQAYLIYLLCKVRRLFASDNFYVYFRLPHTTSIFKLRKPGYRWRCELQTQRELVWEVRKLRETIEGVDNEQ